MNAAVLEAYRELEARFRRISLIGQANGFLGWDWATMMPPASAESRTDQMAELKLIRHEIMADPKTADLLDRADSGTEALGDWQRANLTEMRRAWRHATAVPADLVQALTKAGSVILLL